ncbi:HSF-type DNA-binding domain protein [Cooperia oncophora]
MKNAFVLISCGVIVEIVNSHIVSMDESGYSFHIIDPYSFCRNVLPHFFKHNNLNSLIRQLNMYGFRKMTPVDRGSLARTESDQDHLEFSHPYFIRDHPEFLVNIKRKLIQSNFFAWLFVFFCVRRSSVLIKNATNKKQTPTDARSE